MLASKLLSCAGGEETLFSDDVFQSYTRTGTGADAVVTTGIDMTKGYMLWSKGRSAATDHAVYDSARGVTLDLVTNSTAAQTTQSTGLKAVSSTGHTVGSLAKMNTSSATYVDWVFRKATKFFDVVTYTGDNTSGRAIPHSLGVAPGVIIIKRTQFAGDWIVYHRSLSAAQSIYLNTTAAAAPRDDFANTAPTATHFYVDGVAGNTNNNQPYVAYLFAHDTSADGIVQCGSYVGNGSATTVNLGWEPQWLMVKRAVDVGFNNDWRITDSMRGVGTGVSEARLLANTSGAEASVAMTTAGSGFNAVGFTQTGSSDISNNAGGSTYIYLAIRRPNKPPTTGTQVYNAIARTGTGAAATVTGVGFAPDLVAIKERSSVDNNIWFDRLRGASQKLFTNSTSSEIAEATNKLDLMDGYGLGTGGDVNASGSTYSNHFFKRAPGFHSEICYTGTGSNKTEVHDLGKAPDLMIVKSRSSANDWNVWCNGLSGTEKLVLNSTAAKVTDATAWNSTTPTSSVISLGTAAGTNANTTTYVAYLFSNLSGIQSIGTYIGDGTSGRLINCGFTTGSRFVMIKAISTIGNWLIADTTRGITSGNDPYLSLNSTAAEVTTEDWLDPSTNGFLVNQVSASNANVNGVTYMYWSIA